MKLSDIPKSVPENLAYRQRVLTACAKGRGAQHEVETACAADPLVFLNLLGWTYDPRLLGGKTEIPFVTWDFQDEALRAMSESLGREDALVAKSRDMGASWLVLGLYTYRWLWGTRCDLGLSSSTEALVDSGPNPKSLFWKIRFLLENLPPWLLQRKDYFSKELLLHNKKTGSTLSGFTTTPNIARGARMLSCMVDEFAAFEFGDGYRVNAATAGATYSRFFNSTFQGAAGCFYDLWRVAKEGKGKGAADRVIRLIEMHWTLHPRKREGLYYDERGKARSPEYDRECQRLGQVRALIGAELDMDPAGSVGQFFPAELIDRLVARESRPAYHRGRLVDGLFQEDDSGPLWLWTNPSQGKVPFGEKYSVGCDVAVGTGASNSVASCASQTTGEKVAELASPNLSPDEFADATLALCHWLNGAYLLWEKNGPGVRFGMRVMESGYRNVYYQQNEQSLSKKVSDTPGWTATDPNKRMVYGEYVSALLEGRFTNRCKEALEECRLIVWDPSGKIVNSRAQASIDPTGARENHADRPTADALCNKGLGEIGPKPAVEQRKNEPDPRTFQGRRELREAEQARADAW